MSIAPYMALLFSIFLLRPAIAEELEREIPASPPGSMLSIALVSRVDSFAWNEASNSVNIASELKWKNLRSVLVSSGLQLDISQWNLTANLDYGEIQSGDNQDSDYNGNDRTQEYSRSNNRAGGKVMDFSLGLSRPVYSGMLIPAAGYSFHIQSLTMYDGYQAIPATGSYAGLNNVYQAIWNGPWIGLGTNLLITSACRFTAGVQYHMVDFYAAADWNLRSEFSHPVSFIQRSHGEGITAKLEFDYELTADTLLDIGLSFQTMHASPGTDTTFFANGTTATYRLNEAVWEATSIHAGLNWKF